MEDDGDLPGPIALLRDQWAECSAGETGWGEPGRGAGGQPTCKVQTLLKTPMPLIPRAAPAHGTSHSCVYSGLCAPDRPGEATVHRCA